MITFVVLLQVTLHDGVTGRAVDGCFDEQWMTVAVAVDADAGDEVQLYAAVAKFNERAVAKSTGEIRKVQVAVANRSEGLQRFRVPGGKFRIRPANRCQFCLVFGNRLHDQFLGFLEAWVGLKFFRREHRDFCQREDVGGL